MVYKSIDWSDKASQRELKVHLSLQNLSFQLQSLTAASRTRRPFSKCWTPQTRPGAGGAWRNTLWRVVPVVYQDYQQCNKLYNGVTSKHKKPLSTNPFWTVAAEVIDCYYMTWVLLQEFLHPPQASWTNSETIQILSYVSTSSRAAGLYLG